MTMRAAIVNHSAICGSLFFSAGRRRSRQRDVHHAIAKCQPQNAVTSAASCQPWHVPMPRGVAFFTEVRPEEPT